MRPSGHDLPGRAARRASERDGDRRRRVFGPRAALRGPTAGDAKGPRCGSAQPAPYARETSMGTSTRARGVLRSSLPPVSANVPPAERHQGALWSAAGCSGGTKSADPVRAPGTVGSPSVRVVWYSRFWSTRRLGMNTPTFRARPLACRLFLGDRQREMPEPVPGHDGAPAEAALFGADRLSGCHGVWSRPSCGEKVARASASVARACR